MPPPDREEIARRLTEVRTALLQIGANNLNRDRVVTLPRSAEDALRHAELNVAEACQQMLDHWNAMTPDSEAE